MRVRTGPETPIAYEEAASHIDIFVFGRIMKNLTLPHPTLSSYLALIENEPGEYRRLFRGQTNSAWGLTPALYRTVPNVGGGTMEANFDFFEARLLERFFDEALPYLPPLSRSYSNDRIVAQHFGVPTRLLDWTHNPFVALFFALDGAHQSTTDAAIFAILPDAFAKPEQLNGSGPHQVIAFDPPAIDRRIPAQRSAFTFHPYGPPGAPFVPVDQRPDIGNWITVDTGRERAFTKIIIPSDHKRHLWSALAHLGYDRRTLFPGLDGVGAFVTATQGRL